MESRPKKLLDKVRDAIRVKHYGQYSMGKKGNCEVRDEDMARLSPLRRRHINMLGRYHFSLPEAQRQHN
jgi:Tn3 transposase DDE domain